jgi:hypothetical protein
LSWLPRLRRLVNIGCPRRALRLFDIFLRSLVGCGDLLVLYGGCRRGGLYRGRRGGRWGVYSFYLFGCGRRFLLGLLKRGGNSFSTVLNFFSHGILPIMGVD